MPEKLFLVSYDLMKQGQDYERLIARLSEWKALRIQYSTWLLRWDTTVTEIRDDLRKYIDGNDRLFVAILTGATAWHNSIPGDDAVKRFIQR